MAHNAGHTNCRDFAWRELPIFLVVLATLVAALPAVASPRIQIDPESMDFGVMKQHQTEEALLTITNTGDTELLLRDVNTTCGCTVAELPTKVLAPGASTNLKVSFSSKRYEGPQMKFVHIFSNDPDRGSLEVPVTADIRMPVYTTPIQKQLGFRACAVGVSQTTEMFFETKDIESLELSATITLYNVFHIRFKAHDDPGQKTMIVTLKSEAPAGVYKDIIKVRTNHPDMPTMEIEVRARVDADIFANPTEVKFRYVQRDQTMRNRIRVRSYARNIEWKVTKVEFDLPNFTAEIDEKIPNIETFIRISGTPVSPQHELARENKGRIKGKMRIYTTLESVPMLEVDISYLLRI